MSFRKAAVAGLFYEADPALLQQQIGDLMSEMGSPQEAIPDASGLMPLLGSRRKPRRAQPDKANVATTLHQVEKVRLIRR